MRMHVFYIQNNQFKIEYLCSPLGWKQLGLKSEDIVSIHKDQQNDINWRKKDYKSYYYSICFEYQNLLRSLNIYDHVYCVSCEERSKQVYEEVQKLIESNNDLLLKELLYSLEFFMPN